MACPILHIAHTCQRKTSNSLFSDQWVTTKKFPQQLPNQKNYPYIPSSLIDCMRPEVENWVKQAEADLENAAKNIKIKAYYVTAFLSQQAAEKILKALFIKKYADLPPKTHTLYKLGQEVKAPKDILVLLRKLTPEFLVTRYPDAAAGVPAEIYDETAASESLECADKVVKWAKRKLR